MKDQIATEIRQALKGNVVIPHTALRHTIEKMPTDMWTEAMKKP